MVNSRSDRSARVLTWWYRGGTVVRTVVRAANPVDTLIRRMRCGFAGSGP